MKNLIKSSVLLFLFISLAGCATSRPDTKSIVAEAFGQPEFTLADIPSHGLIGDGLVIAAAGGSNATGLKNAMLAMNDQGGDQYIAVTSSNSLLAKTVLENAVKKLPKNSLSHIHIAFAGDPDHGEALREPVLKTGAQFLVLPL